MAALHQDLWLSTRRLIGGLREHNALSVASAMAFQFFLSMVPLLALVGYVLGHMVRSRGIEAMMAPILEALPNEAALLVKRQLEGLAGSVSAPSGAAGLFGFFFVATTGTHHLMDVFEVMLLTVRRSWWQQRAIALAWLAATTGALTTTTWLLLKGDAKLHADDHARIRAAIKAAQAAHLPKPAVWVHHAPWERLVAGASILAVALVALAALYRVAVVHPRELRRKSWPGAALAIALGFLVSYAFAAFAESLGSYTAYYGGLAAVAVVLVWLYLASLALLAGAELNAQLEGVRSKGD